ncbi:MAG: hypothetical protein K2P81_02450 [Bacteriovoracaceae bacterium]|nr:hypothetical protein [Bacteriovoracaceae bacterium]
MSIFVKRCDSSSYFPPDFESLERKMVESIEGLSYLGTKENLPTSGDLILMTNTHTKLSAWIQYKPRIKAIIHPNSGFDNLASDFETWRDVPIYLGNSIRAQAVTEWTLSSLFQLMTFIRHTPHWPKSREWNRDLVSEKKTLILGFGHIGKKLKQHLPHAEVFDPWENQKIDLHQRWEVVLLAASLNKKNHHIIDENFLSHAAPDLILINGARGELIDDEALMKFLQSHPQARAVLDVHSREPYQERWNRQQVKTTPHIAGVWNGLCDSMLEFEKDSLQKMIQGKVTSLMPLSLRMTEEGFLR